MCLFYLEDAHTFPPLSQSEYYKYLRHACKKDRMNIMRVEIRKWRPDKMITGEEEVKEQHHAKSGGISSATFKVCYCVHTVVTGQGKTR